MKQIWKRMLALLCALTLVCGGIMTQGNSQTANASDEEQSATVEGAEFGKTDSYLQLTESLAATPSAVEATVKMDKCDEWTIVSAAAEANSVGYQGTTVDQDWETKITTRPDSSLTYSGFTGEVEKNYGFRKSFDIHMPDVYEKDEIAIAFWIYSSVDINTQNGELEITSSGKSDEQEISWKIGTDVVITGGEWNYIKLPLNSATTVDYKGTFDLCNVKYLRWYSTNTGSENVTFAISDVKLVVLEDDSTEWTLASTETLSSSSVTGNDVQKTTWNDTLPGTGMEYVQLKSSTVRCNIKDCQVDASAYQDEELAVSFWIYSSATLSNLTLELSSSASNDTEELEWDFGADVNSGWNYIELPLSEGSVSAEGFNKNAISRVRIHTSKVNSSATTEPEIYVSEIKLVNTGIKYSFTNAKANFNVTDTYTTIASDVPGGGLVCHEYTATNNQTVLAKWEITDTTKAINLSSYSPDEIALAFWVYSDIANPKGTIELGSDKSNIYKVEMDSCGIQAGWNYVEIPLSSITQSGTVNLSSICWMRIHTMTITGDNVIRMSEPVIKIHKVTESSSIVPAHMIFSNVNAEGEAYPYALAVTKNGYPTFIYGAMQYTLDYDIRTNEEVALKLMRNSEGKIAFYIDGGLRATSENVADALGVPTTAYCIGADGLGNQFMQGSIYKVCVSYGDDSSAEWNLSSDVSKDIPDAQGSGIYAEYKGTAVQACPYVTRYYGTIDSYRETVVDGKYTNVPQKEGYVFAGWYTDETCADPLAFDTTADDAYAKFVDGKILTVLAQSKYTEGSENQKLDIRFVTTVDELNYKEVGFVVTNRAGTKYTYPEQYVYTSLNAAGVTYAPADKFSQHSTRFATIQMTGVTIENESDGISANRYIPVQAYWVTKDGSIVYGTARKVNVQVAATNAASGEATAISAD